MPNDYVSPLALQVFHDQPPMAMVRLILAAKQDALLREQGLWNALLDLALSHQRQESLLIAGPITAMLLVFVEQLLSRRQHRLVMVGSAADGLQEILEVVTLRESGELRYVIETRVDQLLYSASS